MNRGDFRRRGSAVAQPRVNMKIKKSGFSNWQHIKAGSLGRSGTYFPTVAVYAAVAQPWLSCPSIRKSKKVVSEVLLTQAIAASSVT